MPATVPDSYKPIGQNMTNLAKALANTNANLSTVYAARGQVQDTNDFIKKAINNIPTFDGTTN